MNKHFDKREEKTNHPAKDSPQYEPPVIITYDGDDILEELGPAQTCAKAGCPVDGL